MAKLLQLLCIGCLLNFSPGVNSATMEQIKTGVTDGSIRVDEAVGIGGRYGFLRATVSSKEKIESDHFPPKFLYKYAKDNKIKNLREDDVAAISLPYQVHREFETTGGKPFKNEADWENPERMDDTSSGLASLMKDAFKEGNYYHAVDLSLNAYAITFSYDSDTQSFDTTKMFDNYKPGIIQALDVHTHNKLITEKQKEELISKYELDKVSSSFPPSANRDTILNKLEENNNKNGIKYTDPKKIYARCGHMGRGKRSIGPNCFSLKNLNAKNGQPKVISTQDGLSQSVRASISPNENVGRASQKIGPRPFSVLQSSGNKVSANDLNVRRIAVAAKVKPAVTKKSALKLKRIGTRISTAKPSANKKPANHTSKVQKNKENVGNTNNSNRAPISKTTIRPKLTTRRPRFKTTKRPFQNKNNGNSRI